jgi:nucleoside-diphosphate-sugar epimerase
MKILIVGGAGYVGGSVTNLLNEKGYDVTIYDNLLYENEFLKKCNFIYGDVRDKKKLKKLFKIYDAIIWIAALVGDGACNINPNLTHLINFEPVKFLSDHYEGRIIFFSTCSVYGAQKGILDERSKVNPLSHYALSKLRSEKVLKNKNSIIFRLGTLFGISDNYSRLRLDLVVNTLTAKAFCEKKITIFGGGQYRPLLHVKDAAEAIFKGLTSNKKGIYNLSLDNFKIKEISKKVKKFFPELRIINKSLEIKDLRDYQVNNLKSKAELDFIAKRSVEEGILEIKKLLQENRIKDINNPRYTNQKFLELFKKNDI